MKKVLIVNTSGMGIGGITSHMINYVSMLKDEYDFTIVATIFYEKSVIDKFENMGCTVVNLAHRKRNLIKYINELNNLIKDGNFDIIHVHGNSATMVFELELAKKYGVKKRIAHCHNSICNHKILHKLLKNKFSHSYTDAVACSKLAGDWIFGKDNYMVLHNAIDLEKFRYNHEIRVSYRKMLGIDDETLLVGHIGNFNEQKNHEFLVNVFFELQKVKKSKLILIGEGPLQEAVKNQVKQLQIDEKVHFMGIKDDVNCWMQAMDIFLLPSRWEGLPVTLIEAQASGLYCVISDNVSKEVIISSNQVSILEINNAVDWVKRICSTHYNADRASGYENIQRAGYDIKKAVDNLNYIYNR